MSTGSELTVSAPGRIWLFGDHQDFLGLAVIAAAIDRQITIKGTPRDDQVIHIEMPDIDDSDSFNLQDTIPYRGQRDYLRSVVNVLRRQDICWPGNNTYQCGCIQLICAGHCLDPLSPCRIRPIQNAGFCRDSQNRTCIGSP